MNGQEFLKIEDRLLERLMHEFRILPNVGTGKVILTFEFNCNTNGIGTVKIKQGNERDLIPNR